jgi:hypothetical protein
MWLTLLKVLLIVWLAVGLTVIVIVGVRRSRANRGDPNWSRRTGKQSGYEASIRGSMPATPLPEWVDRDFANRAGHAPPTQEHDDNHHNHCGREP